MRASHKTYEEVAKRCSEFLPVTESKEKYVSCHECSCTVSCVNCKHFEQEHCVLDIYDKIMENHNL